MFKVNNKDASVSVVNLEHVAAGWEDVPLQIRRG